MATGLLVALISVTFTVSFATVIFSGPLAHFRDVGITMALTGATVYGVFSALTGSVPGTWWGNQTPQVVLVALGAASIATAMEGADDATLFATVVAFIVISTFAAGLVVFVIGSAGLAQQAKFIPYPVVGGFLAVTGLFLILRTSANMADTGPELAQLVNPSALGMWLPYALGGLAIAVAARWFGGAIALGLGVAIYLAGFAVYAWLGPRSLVELEAAGLLMGGGASPGIVPIVALLPEADLSPVLGQMPTIGAIVLMTILGIVMGVSGLELQMRRSFRLNSDMRMVGLANMIASTAGGFVGYHSVSMYQLSRVLMPMPVPAIGLTAAAVFIVLLIFGMGAIAFLPKGAFAIVLCFMGFDLLWRWVIEARRGMPTGDYAIVLGILATSVFFGFVVAILVGIVAASLMFTVAYSRIDVVRNKVSGRLRLSPTERSARDIATLVDHGHQTLVFELQGYLFFGTANGLFEKVADEVTRDGAAIKHLLVDFRRVDGMDVSTSFVLARLVDLALQNGVRVGFTGLSEGLNKMIAQASPGDDTAFDRTLADGLNRVEEEILSEAATAVEGSGDPPSEFGVLLQSAAANGPPLVEARQTLEPGQVLFTQGDRGDSLAYLESGRLSAWVGLPDGSQARVASFLAGAVVGEIAFSSGAHRTASVVADTPTVVLRVSQRSLETAIEHDPETGTRFYALLSRLLAERLGRTTALFFAIDN